jgi:hypothetical protein
MAIQTNLFFTTRDQVFTVTVYGLRPLTRHYCFFERKLVPTSQIKPLNGNIGESIITDENGSATFDFYYQSGASLAATSVAEAQRFAASIAGTKELVVTNLGSSSIDVGYENLSDSFFTTQIQISVFIPSDNEFETIKVPYQPPPPVNTGVAYEPQGW